MKAAVCYAVCETRTVKVCVTPGVIGTVTEPLTVEPSGAVVLAVTVIEVAVSVAGIVTTTDNESADAVSVAFVSSAVHVKVEPTGSGIAFPLSSSSAVKVPVLPALIAITSPETATVKWLIPRCLRMRWSKRRFPRSISIISRS